MGLGIMIDVKTIAPLVALILAGLIYYLRRKKERSVGYILCFTVFCIYLVCVAHYTLFPILLFNRTLVERGVNWKTGLNFIPFRELTLSYLSSVQGVGNILLLLPFGFGLPFISQVNFRTVIWKGALFSVSIELLQFIENISHLSGYLLRTVDINDVILNVIGAILGFIVFQILSWAYCRSTSPNETVKGVWKHIHGVLTKSEISGQ
ncbi:VanZ like family protein [Peptococcaceae bacterium CEB3]|nr:VanZ like family protein [Peptococcaceae bacterium CEB3]